MILGAKRRVRVVVQDLWEGASLSGTTAGFVGYDSTDGLVGSPPTPSLSGTTRLIVSVTIQTGSGGWLTASGLYRCYLTLTFPDTQVEVYRIDIRVLPVPG